MNIVFWGQLGLSRLFEQDNDSAESRVAALAHELAAKHTVTVLGTAPYIARSGTAERGLRLRRLPSLDPQMPGGWLYTLLGVWAIWRTQPDVVHVHGWRAASVRWLAALGSWQTTFIWTIDRLPDSRLSRLFSVRWLARGFASVAVTTRELQYILLTDYGVRVSYVPDGYRERELSTLSVRRYGLRPERYTVVLADSAAEVRQVMRAFRGTGIRQNVVVLQENRGPFKRLARQFARVKVIGALTGRARLSIIAQASNVIVADDSVSPSLFLQVMALGKPVVSVAASQYQELAGVTVPVVAAGDEAGMRDVLMELHADTPATRARARKAARRAQRHFTWERIAADYVTLYQALPQLVPIDSIQQKRFTELPA